MATMILPGTYIEVRAEGLITAGRVATGNIGIVGTAEKGPVNKVQLIGSFAEAKAIFGEKGAWKNGSQDNLTLIRSLEYVFNNGGATVYAVRAKHTNESCILNDSSEKPLIHLSTYKYGNNTGATAMVEVDSNNKKITVEQDAIKEVFSAADAKGLIDQINSQSKLVSAKLDDNATGTDVPADTTVAAGFKGWANATEQDYIDALEKLENEIINIVLLAGQDASDPGTVQALTGHINTTKETDRERIGIIGCSTTDNIATIESQISAINSDRLIFVAPGIRVSNEEHLSGAYTAAAFAGLLASLPVQASPTNKVLAIPGLLAEFNKPELEKLVQAKVVAIEKREGYRIVKGVTTASDSAWHQITTRRIVDFAIAGVRSGCNPYIGKLNNERVRGAMKATLDAFLTRMVEDEALISYELDVTATRPQEIAGEAIVTMVLRPTFSIDFIRVTMYLQ